jgi:hypothetical protein
MHEALGSIPAPKKKRQKKNLSPPKKKEIWHDDSMCKLMRKIQGKKMTILKNKLGRHA